jgi:hypothetical protein
MGGGGGGGAILIGCSQTVSIVGSIKANGGKAWWPSNVESTGAGSGGGIRIICDQLECTGSLLAVGGEVWSSTTSTAGPVGLGRIRLERVLSLDLGNPDPAPSLVDLPANATALLWPPAGSPEVRVLSIGGESAPSDPRAAFGTFGADVALPEVTEVTVLVETTNVEPESEVTVRLTPRDTFDVQVVTAQRIDPPVSNDPLVYQWAAVVPTQLGYAAVQVKVVRP